MTTLYIVLPCYNEEAVIEETARRIYVKLNNLIAAGVCTTASRIVFVDDGSRDSTWEKITELYKQSNMFSGIKLAHNRGHQNALLAGLMTAKDHCDCIISMDADLQDDIDAIDEMLEKFQSGCDIVYGVRKERATDTAFKRTTAEGFYKVMKLLGVDLVFNHADYRLMSRRALESLAEYNEVNLFLRGIVPHIGFKTDKVYYSRANRFAGETKYPLSKMISFSIEGITSFSVRPLRMVFNLGVIMVLLSLLAFIPSAIVHSSHPMSLAPYFAPAIINTWLVGGLIITCLGVVGEYIGKIYNEVKARPRFKVEDFLNR